jgi:Holliday junction resolvase-like predicted endonuclease
MTRNNKHIKGDQAELIAQEFFIKKGYYVFNNISQHGPADMVVLDKDGYTLLVDVKAISLRSKNGWKVNRVPSEENRKN